MKSLAAFFPPSLPLFLAWKKSKASAGREKWDGRKKERGEGQQWINSTHEAGRMTAETQLFLRTVLADMLAPEAEA